MILAAALRSADWIVTVTSVGMAARELQSLALSCGLTSVYALTNYVELVLYSQPHILAPVFQKRNLEPHLPH